MRTFSHSHTCRVFFNLDPSPHNLAQHCTHRLGIFRLGNLVVTPLRAGQIVSPVVNEVTVVGTEFAQFEPTLANAKISIALVNVPAGPAPIALSFSSARSTSSQRALFRYLSFFHTVLVRLHINVCLPLPPCKLSSYPWVYGQITFSEPL